MNKKRFCVSSKKLCLKDNNKTAHCVSHSRLRSLYTYYFPKENNIDDIQASLTGTKF